MNREAEILFHELADLSPAQRESYFRKRQVPSEVRAEVEKLLHFDSEASNSLTGCVARSAESLLQTSAASEQNRLCGPYRLVRLLGRGGMGSVYLAQRVDGEVEQRVAIKFLHYGADQPAFLDRFLRERQILATLSHPGISRLLDAGRTGDGQPYLAMEYVDGTPIDVHAANLDLAGKLALFLRVCEAVSYAHRNLVIHRDIKPSNILVDASGDPKLLDFGIAKILDATVDQTRTQERLLTPEYASPEQILGAAQATTTDIYSLGAVLYLLLTGRSPHAFASESRQDIEFAICQTEPAAPSSVNSSLPRDLDFIVRKALRKEPEERYSSADAFADDIRAYLESRPVKARSGNAWYRTRKFVRRYRLLAAAVAMTLASLTVGLYVANRERAIAQRRFVQVRQLANKVLALDEVIRVLPGSTKARKEIVAMSQEYLEALETEARRDQDLAVEVAGAYLALARAQGVPIAANLGDYARAEISLKRADALLDPVLNASPRNRKALLFSAGAAHARMILASTDHRRDEALAEARTAAARLDSFLALGQASPSETETTAQILSNIALLYKNQHLYDPAVLYARRAIEIAQSSPTADSQIGNALSILADASRFSGDLEGALRAIREARSRVEKAVFSGETARRSSLFNVLWREGAILGQDGNISLDRTSEAVEVLQRAFDLTEEWARKDSNDASSRILLGSAARELGMILRHDDPKRALQVDEKALFHLGEIENNTNMRRAEARLQAVSSYSLRKLNRVGEAKNRIDAAFRLLRQTKDYPADRINPDDEADLVLRALGDHYAETDQARLGAQVYQELLDKIMAYKPDPQNDIRHATKLSQTYEALASLDRRLGDGGRAEAMDALRVELWQGWERKLPKNPFVLRQIAAKRAD